MPNQVKSIALCKRVTLANTIDLQVLYKLVLVLLLFVIHTISDHLRIQIIYGRLLYKAIEGIIKPY